MIGCIGRHSIWIIKFKKPYFSRFFSKKFLNNLFFPRYYLNRVKGWDNKNVRCFYVLQGYIAAKDHLKKAKHRSKGTLMTTSASLKLLISSENKINIL